MTPDNQPFPAFLFSVDISINGTSVCGGMFSEVSGLEATMEPFAIREGGRNWGQVQRAGRISFSTVILKRGMTVSRDLWSWFAFVNREQMALGFRADARIIMRDFAEEENAETSHRPTMIWKLYRTLPVKFKIGDLNASSSQIAIEELHLVHQGIRFDPPT
jgi:phage tail-like protein